MSPLTTILLYVVAPLGGLLLIAAATTVRSSRGTRYRAGGEWPHEPLWWMGNPRGSGVPEPTMAAASEGARLPHTARGGARGTW